MVNFDLHCSHHELQKHLANLGLSTNAIGLDIEQPLHRFFAVSLASDRELEAEALLDVIRHVRQARRFDLISLCESLQPGPVESSQITKEFILLYVDAEDWPRLRRFIELRPNITVDFNSHYILKLLAQRETNRAGDFVIWPNEHIGYAPKTSIFNVSAAVITRQRTFIDALLNHLSKQT